MQKKKNKCEKIFVGKEEKMKDKRDIEEYE